MKTAISIAADAYASAEDLRRRLKMSRSQLYTEAVREYLARHDHDTVTAALNRLVESVDSRADRFVSTAGRQLLERVEW